jgi:ribose transport system permease protein
MGNPQTELLRGRIIPDTFFIKLVKQLPQEKIVALVTVFMLVVFAIFVNRFATFGNALNLLRSVSVLGILSCGMAMVVIARGLDLSQVASMSLSAAWIALLMTQGVSPGLALLAGLGLVLIVGLINGFLIAFVEIPALFTTLATGMFLFGFGRVVMVTERLNTYVPLKATWWLFLGQGTIVLIPVPIIIFAISAGIAAFFLTRARRGVFLYAHGDSAETSRVTGIGVRPQILLEYVLCAVFGFIGGMVMAGSTGAMDLTIFNTTLIFDVILVIVLGGISLSGGRGSINSVLAGTCLIGTVLNAMTLMNLQNDLQNIIKGLILLSAILLDNYLHPRDEETARQGDI